jgi:hypothetical protein
MKPFAIYDTARRVAVYIGLHACSADCWAAWLDGRDFWEAKKNGLICPAVICTFDPRKPL